MLSVCDELFLLALDEENGNFLRFTRKSMPFGLAGAILAELALQGIVCSNEKQRLLLNKADPTGDEILDEIIQEIQSTDKHRKISYWVSLLSEKPKKLRNKVGESLAARELLDQDENRFYWRGRSPETHDPSAPSKFERKIPLRSLVLGAPTQADPDPRSLALLNVLSACDLLNLVFTEDELPAAKHLIHEEVMQAAMKNPNLETIEKIQLGILASIEDEEDS